MAIRSGHRRGALIVAVIGMVACGPPSDQGGRMDWEWLGAKPDSGGHYGGRGIARWCAPEHLLMVSSESGDTGVAVALHVVGEVRTDSFEVTKDTVRPRASIGARIADKTHLVGWAARTGWVRITRVTPAKISGVFRGEFDAKEGGTAINGRGRFVDVPIVRIDGDCARRFVVPPR